MSKYVRFNFSGNATEGSKALIDALVDKIEFIAVNCDATEPAVRRHLEELDPIVKSGQKFKLVPDEFPRLFGVILDPLVSDVVSLKAVKLNKRAKEQIEKFLTDNGLDPALLKPRVQLVAGGPEGPTLQRPR